MSTGHIWDRFLTERDKQVFATSGYGARQGFGKRPALLVVDVNYFFCGDRPEPILESIKRWRNSCGEEAWKGVAAIRQLLDVARPKGIPVIYTTGTQRADQWNRGSWAWKNSRTVEDVSRKPPAGLPSGQTIVPDIAPGPRDVVIEKEKPSAFFGTPLASYLALLQCDSVILTGTTTSGCVRATVLDAFSLNYRVSIVEEGCFDRSEASHAINLCDMHAKYADVIRLDEALSYLAAYPAGQFADQLPSGRGMPGG